jgi:PAS domain S-box-containing protein
MRPSRFFIPVISIKHRLPLLIGALLLGIIMASTWASYMGVKESSLDVGRERLQNLTKQLAILFQQSNQLLLTKTFTTANEPAVKTFLLSPSPATRSGASASLRQLATPEDKSNLQIELWNTSRSLVLSVPDGASPESLDLQADFKAAAVDPFKTSGPMRVIKDVITAPVVVAVQDDSGKPIGYLVRWRQISITPTPKVLTDLLGSDSALYIGNIHGDLLTNLERITSKPRADMGSASEVMQYSRDGNRVLALGRPIAGTPWFLAIEFPERPLLTPAHQFLKRILLADLVVFMVGMAGALVFSRGITQPLQVLTEAASAIGCGDYSRTVDIHQDDELGALATAFNRMVVTTRDSQQVLRESEERLETIIENLHEGLVISDLNGQLTNFNQAGLKMHGFASLEEGLKNLPEFHQILELSALDGTVLKFEEWPLARVMAGEELTEYEVRLRRTDKDWNAIFSYGGSIVKAPNGQLLAFLTIIDITERKRIEAKIKLYSAKLERSNSELQDFAQIASHDLQEPLRKILAFGDRLKARTGESLDQECQDYLQRMFNAATRMQTLITDLMTFSRVETKGQSFVPTDLGVIAREVSADLETLIERTGGRVEIEELPTMDADPVQMRQLLQNLIGNSLKYYRAGVPPVVRIYSQKLDERRRESLTKSGAGTAQLTQILVKDNGIGFDEKYLDRIFTMFQRLHKKGEYEGTGVGLAICRKIVDRHGGTITARSQPAEGTTFVVTMPVTQPKEVEVL